MVYETLLGFAVLFLPFLIYEVVTKSGHSSVVEHGRQALAFLVLGAYFINQWSRQGQTLAMRTWRIKVTAPGQAGMSLQASAVRYLLSWLWVLPAAIACYLLDLHQWRAVAAIGLGIALWAATALFDKDRQFLHDRLAGTRLVQLPKPEKKARPAK